ncbi:MAG: hypothetical protein Q4Q25_04550, partial [Methanocorpusculum sp.]|nr:hypothetical protein [Methanocorpusculum sp.]
MYPSHLENWGLVMARDFSNAVAKIREAHADANAILRKWRDLVESDLPVVMKLKDSAGVPYEITMPSIKAAIDRYLANTFSSLKLTSNYGDVSFRLNDDGDIVVEDSNGALADVLVNRIVTNTIAPAGATLNLIGTVTINSGNLNSCMMSNATVNNAIIKSASFTGTTTISGNTTITGNVSGLTGSASSLTTDFLSVGKQTIQWVRPGEITNNYETRIDSNGNYTGGAAELEAMRFSATMDINNYCDC